MILQQEVGHYDRPTRGLTFWGGRHRHSEEAGLQSDEANILWRLTIRRG